MIKAFFIIFVGILYRGGCACALDPDQAFSFFILLKHM